MGNGNKLSDLFYIFEIGYNYIVIIEERSLENIRSMLECGYPIYDLSILIMYEVSLLLVLLPYSLFWPLLLDMLVVQHHCPLLTEYATDVEPVCLLKILFSEESCQA